MRRFTMAIALTGILSVSALAGDIPFDYTPPPPPPPPPPGMVANSPGEIPSVPGEIPCDLTQQAESAAYTGLLAVVGWLV
ncbi:MAG TPA: hypothetical protein VEW46_01985 [Pyrinomonadaceae bacterium]|nr:hypothetical protein [Pyrinomonadaceae bacterium]